MKNLKKIHLPLFVAILVILAASFSNTFAKTLPDYSGDWKITFYNSSGIIEGVRTISIDEDGSISAKANIYINNVVYLTSISATVSPTGIVKEGTLTSLPELEEKGKLTGSFTETEGKGTWKDYYGGGGTWTAIRSDKKAKD